MIKKFDQIIKDIEKKQYDPVYFLCGEETYFIDRICDQLIENILSPSEKDFNQTIAYGKELNPANIIETALRYPLMAAYNVVVIKEAQELKKMDELIPYFEKPNTATILIICYKHSSLDKRTTFYKAVEKNTCLFISEKIKEYHLMPWITDYLNKSNFKIDPVAGQLLIEYLGNDLGIIINQIDKLIMLKKDQETIGLADIEKHIGISREYNIFELQDAIGLRNMKKIAKIYNFIQSNPKDLPLPLIINILFTFFSRLYVLEHAKGNFSTVSAEIGIPPYQVDSYKKYVGNYARRSAKILEYFQEFDLRFKGVGDMVTEETELTKELIYKIVTC
jgi:DNA polymerase III subunit delta